MPLVKHDSLVDDPWVTVAAEDALPLTGHIIVDLDRWQRDRETLITRNAWLGIRLKSDQPASLIAADLAHFALVALEFPAFKDGRAFSTARLLRERHGFDGELRAVGQVLRDQLVFMRRCGFDAFEIAGEGALEGWLKAAAEVSVRYQPDTGGQPWTTTLRHAPRPPARSEPEPITARWGT